MPPQVSRASRAGQTAERKRDSAQPKACYVQSRRIHSYTMMTFTRFVSLCLCVAPVMLTFGAAPPSVTDLKSPAPAGSEEPNLAAGPAGNVYLSWLEPVSPKGYALRFS